MEHAINNKLIKKEASKKISPGDKAKTLCNAELNIEYVIKDISTPDEDLRSFLFTLGCYTGEKVTVLSILVENYIINVKDARYSINEELAECILI